MHVGMAHARQQIAFLQQVEPVDHTTPVARRLRVEQLVPQYYERIEVCFGPESQM
jgi:hypothetical protein